ncbi:MAG TPA: His/Gly/Thr/Pro-type tRNA ligase C-terminal domain-containing protein, partial [Blastocatellia bacterium]|nr:His/Gly/Thr/Pro-type tRNA ligase C-terminal domain-containing protein [Blastocatellia bacterium]
DLIGVPYRITFGKKIKEGTVELFTRATRKSEDVSLDSVVQEVRVKIETAISSVDSAAAALGSK